MEKEASPTSSEPELIVIAFTSKGDTFLGLIGNLLPKGVKITCLMDREMEKSSLMWRDTHADGVVDNKFWGLVCLIDSSDPTTSLAQLLHLIAKFEEVNHLEAAEALRTAIIDFSDAPRTELTWVPQLFMSLGFANYMDQPTEEKLVDLFKNHMPEKDIRRDLIAAKRFDKNLFGASVPPNWRCDSNNPYHRPLFRVPDPPSAAQVIDLAILYETCTTEISYLMGLLAGLECRWRPLIRIRKFFDAAQIPHLLAECEIANKLYRCHRQLIVGIAQPLLRPPAEVQVKSFVQEFFAGITEEMFELYLEYRNHHASASGELDMIRFHRYKGWYQAVVELLPPRTNKDKPDEKSYLILPVARIPRYVLLFRELLRRISPQDTETRLLVEELVQKLSRK
eukprot:TRINITY_DN4267_c0_g2_i1.p1 TRINITY_DN4267_c0_g2~~TRINITY_DN4267_c0_g2_i1.p1  ORF type:complete len:395 (+),score=30.88 TRINITY_DN4267_c0_g2_i1:472-1656(+)